MPKCRVNIVSITLPFQIIIEKNTQVFKIIYRFNNIAIDKNIITGKKASANVTVINRCVCCFMWCDTYRIWLLTQMFSWYLSKKYLFSSLEINCSNLSNTYATFLALSALAWWATNKWLTALYIIIIIACVIIIISMGKYFIALTFSVLIGELSLLGTTKCMERQFRTKSQ